MSPRGARVLTWLAVAIGPPVAGITLWWRAFSVHHPWWAFVGTMAWEALIALGALIGRIAGKPMAGRLDQAGAAVDQAFGRRVTRYGRRYREHVLASLTFMDSKGLATVGESLPELDEVFVDVGLAAQAPHQVGTGVLSDAAPGVSSRHSIGEFLDHEKSAVLAVVGAPGSGKTTLLRHVARQVARDARRRRTLPILLELRRCDQEILSDPTVTLAQLVRSTLPGLGVAEPTGWWEAQLRHGSCVILLDGLDEVGRNRDRRAIANWIEAQVAAFPANDLVVTSRPMGYRDAVVSAALVLQSRPFTAEQVEQFLRGWYRAVERRATGTPGPETELRAEEGAQDLLERLSSAPALHDLTVNPLLLTMIANVHRYRGALPGSRADLYGEMCQVMLWRRAEAKQQEASMAGPTKQRLLAQLAYRMMYERVRDLPRARVLSELAPDLRRVRRAPSAEELLEDVSSNGLLVEREKDTYAFAHLTFQEYLAAIHIREKNLQDVLVAGVDESWWRETTLLYTTGGADADPIVRAALESGGVTALSLAFDCDENDVELALELHERLMAMRDAAFEPDAAAEHRRLVAGFLATRHLSRLITTPQGTKICPYPIQADLYRLFLRDTGHRAPDGHLPDHRARRRFVTGIWAPEAVAFVSWVNTLIAESGGAGDYRLPTLDELDYLNSTGRTAQNGESLAKVWTTSRHVAHVELWTASVQPPHDALSGSELLETVQADALRTDALNQIALSAARMYTYTIGVLLTRGSARARDLDSDLVHAVIGGLVLSLARVRVNAVSRDGILERDLGLACDLERVLDLARDLDRDLARELDLDRTLARDLAYAFILDNNQGRDVNLVHILAYAREVARSYTRLARIIDVRQAFEVAREIVAGGGSDLAFVRERGRDLARALARDLAREFDVISPAHPALDLELGPIPDEGRLIGSTVMGSGFASALAMALEPFKSGIETRVSIQEFALALVRNAGITDQHVARISLDTLARTATGVRRRLVAPNTAWSANAATSLAERMSGIVYSGAACTGNQAAALRLIALGLAQSFGPKSQAVRELGDIAAGITLLERRAKRPELLESLILARA